MIINSCSSCGGQVQYSPEDKGLKCDKCGGVFKVSFETPKAKISINEATNINNEEYAKWKESKRYYKCKNCGASVILNSYEIASKCSYCNTHSLVSNDKLPGFVPDCIIPFRIGKDKAQTQFKILLKNKKFLPNNFKKSLPKTQIGATYISSFSFAIDTFASYKGTRAETRTIHTKNGTVTQTYLVPFSGTIARNFDNIVVECSDKIGQKEISGILPYYFNESVKYNDDFLAGFSVEYHNKLLNEANEIAESQAKNMISNIIRNKYNDVTSLEVDVQYSNNSYNYALLPLYFINFQYKGKNYLNLMNGQTGKTSGKLPRSGLKITLFVLSIILLVVGFPLLIVMLSML